jgi:hypothetical protein
MANIQIFPFIATPAGITVCYSKDGKVEQRRFPANTTREEIFAAINGTPPPPKPDLIAEATAKAEEARKRRAAESQVPATKTEEEVKTGDSERERRILDLNAMRSKLKEAKVKGYQLLKGDAVKKKYDELVAQGVIKED